MSDEDAPKPPIDPSANVPPSESDLRPTLELADRATLDIVGEGADRTTLDDARSTLDEIPLEPGGDDAETLERDPQPPKAVSKRPLVYFGVGALFLCAVLGPLVFYFFFFRYTPTAPQHIPEGTQIALRIDIPELVLNGPCSVEVLRGLQGDSARIDKFQKATGIDPRGDLREVVLASPDGQAWVWIFGGRFHRAGLRSTNFMQGFADFLEGEGISAKLEGERITILGTWTAAQADDGTILLGTSKAVVDAAMEPSERWTTLGLQSSGALSWVVDEAALGYVGRQTSSPIFAKSQKFVGFASFGRKPELSFELIAKAGNTEALAKEVETSLASLRDTGLGGVSLLGDADDPTAIQVRARDRSVVATARLSRDKFAGMCNAIEEATKRLQR